MSAVTAIRAQRAINERRAERRGAALTTVVAADFVTGGAADFARVCSVTGEVVELVRRGEGESRIDFAARAKSFAAALEEPRLVFGGIDRDLDPEAVHEAPEAPKQDAVTLRDIHGRPIGLHAGQVRELRTILDNKRTVLRAGRRWGKSKILIALAADEAIRGRPIGYLCPPFKTAVPVFDDLELKLAPLIASKSRGHELRLSTGGAVDIWSLEGSTIVGRGLANTPGCCSTRSPLSPPRPTWGRSGAPAFRRR